MTEGTKPLVICAPEPRTLDLIFTPERLGELRARYDLHEIAAADVDGLSPRVLEQARYIIGQPPLSLETVENLTSLRAVLNVESNLLDNMPYDEVFRRGIHVLTTGAVFAVPVAEMALGMALALARDLVGADSHFRAGTEAWGADSNRSARLLTGADVGIIGFGDLGRALVRLLTGFRCRISVHDPWLPPALIADHGASAASLDEVLQGSDFVFVMSAVTSENKRGLGRDAFARMRPGAAFILMSRAEVVDFDALIDAVESGHISAASDVYPTEPMPPDHRVRRTRNFLLSAHRAGALDVAFKQMGEMVIQDMELMDRGLPPRLCKRAERETAGRMRSRPVDRN